jgi:hypothetical protein
MTNEEYIKEEAAAKIAQDNYMKQIQPFAPSAFEPAKPVAEIQKKKKKTEEELGTTSEYLKKNKYRNPVLDYKGNSDNSFGDTLTSFFGKIVE